MFQNCISIRLLKECFVTFVMDHGAILTGITLSYPSCLIPQLKKEGYYADTFVESVIGSISILTIGFTTLIYMFIIGQTSRKKITQISLIVYGTGTILIIFSKNIILLCIGLVVQSSVVSIFIPITMTYISEVCQKEHRGTFLSSMFVFTTIGLSLNYIFNSAISWRMMAVVTLVITVAGFYQTTYIPESNYWYLLEGKEELAKESMLWFEPSLTDDDLNQRVENIIQANETFNFQKCGNVEILRSLRHKKFLKPVLLGTLINVFRSGSGRVVLGIHIERIFRDLNTPYNISNLISWFGWADVVGSSVILLFVHKVRRKTLMVVSGMVLVVALGNIVAFKFSREVGYIVPPFWVPVVSLYVYAMCVITTYNSIITIIISEIQVPTYRPQMTLIQNGILYFFCSLYSFIFPFAEKILPIQYIFLWFIFNIIVSILMVMYLVPETSKMEFYENEKNTKSNEH